MSDFTKVSDHDLASVLEEPAYGAAVQVEARAELERRKEEFAKPFNPRGDISADARYLWKRIFIWFWVVPACAALIYLLVLSLK